MDNDDVRVEPGISLWKLFIIVGLLWYAFSTGSVIFLGLAIYLLFSAMVSEGFWPYLTEDEEREMRRKKAMESYEDDTDRDSQE